MGGYIIDITISPYLIDIIIFSFLDNLLNKSSAHPSPSFILIKYLDNIDEIFLYIFHWNGYVTPENKRKAYNATV